MNTPHPHPALCRSLFITGTDTGVGKTTVAAGLLRALAGAGYRVAGMKPVAAGAEMTSHGWRNEDALALMAAGNVATPYEWTNPVCLPRATAPHLAAEDAGIAIELDVIRTAFDSIRARSDIVIVEGAGGWRVPLSRPSGALPRRAMEDIARLLQLPVVLVVGIRLGCLNHALLTAAAIADAGLALAGWIANPVDPRFADAGRYVDSLEEELFVPLLWRAPQVILPGQ